MMEGMYITSEWAKQLAFEAFGDLPWKELKIIQSEGKSRRIRLPNIPEVEFRTSGYSRLYPYIDWIEIELQLWGDPINQEYTWLGYCKELNTLVYGPTRAVDPLRIGVI